MKKQYYPTLKYHTIFSVILLIVFLIAILLKPDIKIGLTIMLIVSYVFGNSMIHKKKNAIDSGIVLEYIIVSLIALVIILGTIN